ncbi:hypothetical protein PEBR_31596 [Penicillium brasilianum]|uniref:DUF1203 domain protein n=1 Tax=Penicillium brasilianum TaxID=104259 RepID=A0A1S9RFM8_PENBI|nr:hypothetical protein PEBR_31596 [Penicillium brasilianum]
MLQFTPLPTSLPQSPESMVDTHVKPVTHHNAFPCRNCLQDGLPGEEMLLLHYNPFSPSPSSGCASPYTVPSPIFIHRNPCPKYQCDGSVPEQQRKRLLAVRAYDADQMMVGFAVVKGEELGQKAEELFEDEGVRFLFVYYAGPGCFAVRIDRGE